jgi:CheY-like chemotaxis protein
MRDKAQFMSDPPSKVEKIRVLLIRSVIDFDALIANFSESEKVEFQKFLSSLPAVVPDNYEIADFLNTQWDDIQFLGWAKTGQEGLELAKTHQPDVILVDSHLDDMNASEAVRLIRADLPNSKIITMSPSNNPSWIRGTIEAGADHYACQPLIADYIYNAIRGLHDGTVTSLREQIMSPSYKDELRTMLIEKIEAAFSDIEYPGDGTLYSNDKTRELIGKHWKDIPLEMLRNEDRFLHLSAKALRFYLPAYLIGIINNPDEMDVLVHDMVHFLSPSWEFLQESKTIPYLPNFEREEKAAIHTFLKSLGILFPEINDYPPIREARERAILYWQRWEP